MHRWIEVEDKHGSQTSVNLSNVCMVERLSNGKALIWTTRDGVRLYTLNPYRDVILAIKEASK